MNYNMNELLIKALDMCRVYIGAKRNVTDEDIESAISKILLLFPEVDKASLKDGKHSVNHVFSSPTSIINFTSKKPSYDDTRRSGRDNELLQRAQNDL